MKQPEGFKKLGERASKALHDVVRKGGSIMAKEKEKTEKQETKGELVRRGGELRPFGSPFTFMRRFSEDMDRLFEDFFLERPFGALATPAWPERWMAGREAWPAVEVLEREGKLFVRADLPGMTKDDIVIDVSADTLTIRGERKREHEERKEGYYRSEREYGAFERSIELPAGAEIDKASATFDNGVLEVIIPAPALEAARGRRIPIGEAHPATH